MKGAILLILYLTAGGEVYGTATVKPLSVDACAILKDELTKTAQIDGHGRTTAYACIPAVEVTK